MKFLSSSVLLVISLVATTVSVVTASDANEKVEYWLNEENQKNSVIPKVIEFDEESGTFQTRVDAGDGITKNVVLGDEPERRKMLEWKRSNAEKVNKENKHRKLEEATITEPADKSNVLKDPVPIKASGLTGWEDVKIVVTRGTKTTEIPIPTVDIVGGVLNEHLGNFQQDQEVTFQVSGTKDGAEVSTDEHTFTYAPSDMIVLRSGGTSSTVAEGAYENGGDVLEAVGRIYYTGVDPETGEEQDFACSGTAIKDNKSGRSVILTAAHCVFEDRWQQWGRNAIFVPNRDSVETTLSPDQWEDYLHRPSSDIVDVCGWWTLAGGVVHDKWRDIGWPARLEFDYGFWVVDDKNTHFGSDCGSDALDIAIPALDFVVGSDPVGEHSYNFGYSLDYNPDFRYCSEPISTRIPTTGVAMALWSDTCALSGGASGGPWITNFDPATGTGTIVTVNSWSYNSRDGMGAPDIKASEARCLMNFARETDVAALEAMDDGEEGHFVNCYDRPCVPENGSSERKLRGGRELCAH